MKVIEFPNPHRKKHFDFFHAMNHPHFNICSTMDVTNLVAAIKELQLPVTATIVWMVARAANAVPQLRWRIREGDQGPTVVEHDVAHPSMTVDIAESDCFGFCEMPYEENAGPFIAKATARIKESRENPTFEDEEGRDDYFFFSAIPWIHFTSVQHAMYFHPHDCVPRFTWGRIDNVDGVAKMPLSAQAHHALVDGNHIGKFFRNFEEGVENARELLGMRRDT